MKGGRVAKQTLLRKDSVTVSYKAYIAILAGRVWQAESTERGGKCEQVVRPKIKRRMVLLEEDE